MPNSPENTIIDTDAARLHRRRTFIREVVGLLLGAAAIFVLASTISYLADGRGHHNWMGPLGAALAGFLFDVLGHAVWLTPIPLFSLAAFMFFESGRGSLLTPSWLLPGWTVILLSTSALLSLIHSQSGYGPGGMAGAYLLELIKKLAGTGGGALFLLVFLVAGLMAVMPLTLKEAVSHISRVFRKKQTAKCDQTRPCWGKKKVENTGTKDSINTPVEQQPEGYPRIIEPKKGQAENIIPKAVKEESAEKTKEFHITPVKGEFKLPPLDLLNEPDPDHVEIDKTIYFSNARVLEQKLLDFGVAGKVVEICPGPVVTMYEYSPAPGVKINKVASLADDLALALKTQSVRIVAPIPGKAVIGIELANAHRQTVYLKEILESDVFQKHKGSLPLSLGQDIVGQPVVADLARMPHLLIAGATGTGKSVGLNAMICSLLYRHHPDDLRFLMVDPKRIELSLYDGIPHLLHPVVSEPKEATRALRWVVMEMERRYQILEEAQARNLEGYNKTADEPLPYLVVIIDELADLMMISSKEVESAIARLAQMARAAGIHLLVATQRPSVDVLTGLIKANFPARISFKVSSKVDSRTILDVMGADRLLGMGDMLFLPPGTATLQRIHGAYVSEKEIMKIVNYLKAEGEPQYDFSVVEAIPGEDAGGEEAGGGSDWKDERYDEAVDIVRQTGQASISMLQRRLRVGYNRSARMIEQMESA